MESAEKASWDLEKSVLKIEGKVTKLKRMTFADSSTCYFFKRLEGTEDQRMRGNAEAEASSSKRSPLVTVY